jgi:hypothetical protein
MPDAELDLEELDLDADLDEFDEKDEKPLDSDEDPKMPSAGHCRLLPNLDILVDICRFRPFCSLLACSRRAVDDESGSWITPQMWWPRVDTPHNLPKEGAGQTRTMMTTTTNNGNQNQNQSGATESITIHS